jgi:alpha-beta hydrolase superfamily lysophospholipase
MVARVFSLTLLLWGGLSLVATSSPGSQGVDYRAELVELSPGTSRFVHRWQPAESTPKASFCIVHGLGEHGGRYGQLAGNLVSCGYQVWAFDQQGHGRDSGKRGIITNYDDLLTEVGLLLDHARCWLPDSPCFLFGHSMGGNLAVNFLLRHQSSQSDKKPQTDEASQSGKPLPTAAIVSSPFFRTQREPRGLMNWVARCALRLVPHLRVGTGIRAEWLTDDVQQQDQVNRDPLYHRRVSLGLGAALIDSGRWAIEHADRLTVPTLIIHGTEDFLTLPAGSSDFARRAGKSCRLELLSDHRHETFRDVDRQPVIDLILNFLNSFAKSDFSSPGNDR